MKKTTDKSLAINEDYRRFISDIKAQVAAARLSAARTVNRDLILLYWDIGRGIVEKQKALGWGESVIDRISCDLQAAFPETTGFSPRNLRDMKRFYLAYSDEPIWRQAVAKLTKKGQAGQNRNWQQAVAKLEGGIGVSDILRQLVAEVPWGQNLLMAKLISFNKAINCMEVYI